MLRIRNNRRVCYVLSYFCSMSMLHMFVRYMHTLYEIIHLHHWRRFMHKTLILTSYVHACIITIFKVWNIPIDGYLLSWHAMKIKWPKINLLIFVYSSSINKKSFLQFILKLSQIAFFFLNYLDLRTLWGQGCCQTLRDTNWDRNRQGSFLQKYRWIRLLGKHLVYIIFHHNTSCTSRPSRIMTRIVKFNTPNLTIQHTRICR